MTRKIAKHLASFKLKADLLISKSSISAFRYLMIRHNKSIYPRLFERKNKVFFVATVLLTLYTGLLSYNLILKCMSIACS